MTKSEIKKLSKLNKLISGDLKKIEEASMLIFKLFQFENLKKENPLRDSEILEKSINWMNTENELLFGYSPTQRILAGRHEEVINFLKSKLADS